MGFVKPGFVPGGLRQKLHEILNKGVLLRMVRLIVIPYKKSQATADFEAREDFNSAF